MKRIGVALVVASLAVGAVALLVGAANSSPIADPTVKQAFVDAGNCGNWSCARQVFRAAGIAGPTTTLAPATTTTLSPASTTMATTTTTIPTTTTTAPPPTTTTTQVPSGGKPNASNTGVPPGTTLTPSGNITVTQPGTVIQNKLVTGCIFVQASNVTIKNTKINVTCYNGIDIRPWEDGDSNLTITDVEVSGSGNDNCISWYNFTATRVNLHGCADGAKVGDNTTIRDSYIHDLYAPGCHCDAIQDTGGTGTLIDHTVLGGPTMMGDEFGSLRNITIQNSWLEGGLWGGWNQNTGAQPQNMKVLNNIISNIGSYSFCCVYVAPSTIWTGNTTPGGQPIPHP